MWLTNKASYVSAALSGSNVILLAKLFVIVMTSAEPGRKLLILVTSGGDRVVWQRVVMELPFRTIAMNLNIVASTAYLHYRRFQNTGKVRPSSQPHRESTRKLSS